MADQRELQRKNQELIRKNQELIRKNQQLERELQKRKGTDRGGNIAVAERFREAVAFKKARSTMASGRGALIET